MRFSIYANISRILDSVSSSSSSCFLLLSTRSDANLDCGILNLAEVPLVLSHQVLKCYVLPLKTDYICKGSFFGYIMFLEHNLQKRGMLTISLTDPWCASLSLVIQKVENQSFVVICLVSIALWYWVPGAMPDESFCFCLLLRQSSLLTACRRVVAVTSVSASFSGE